jgi:acyl-CoA synthetase (NDP forming)
LRELLPSFAAVGNPVDLTPQVEASRIPAAVKLVFDDAAVAGVIAVDVGLDVRELGDGIVQAASATGKPVVACVADAPAVSATFRDAGIPVLPTPERAVRAWRALWAARSRPPAPTPPPLAWPADVAAALARTRGAVPYATARKILDACGVRFCRESRVTSAEDASRAAADIGFPVVVKADVDGLVHKTEAGAVILDVKTPGDVLEACRALTGRTGARRFVVQERVGPGVELLVGARRDPTFGPIVAVGTGGVLTETIADVSFRLAPLGEDEAAAMLTEGIRARLLAGPRGLPTCEPAPLVATILAVARLIAGEPRISEVDLNPVIAAGDRAVAVDAVVIVRAPGEETS